MDVYIKIGVHRVVDHFGAFWPFWYTISTPKYRRARLYRGWRLFEYTCRRLNIDVHPQIRRPRLNRRVRLFYTSTPKYRRVRLFYKWRLNPSVHRAKGDRLVRACGLPVRQWLWTRRDTGEVGTSVYLFNRKPDSLWNQTRYFPRVDVCKIFRQSWRCNFTLKLLCYSLLTSHKVFGTYLLMIMSI